MIKHKTEYRVAPYWHRENGYGSYVSHDTLDDAVKDATRLQRLGYEDSDRVEIHVWKVVTEPILWRTLNRGKL